MNYLLISGSERSACSHSVRQLGLLCVMKRACFSPCSADSEHLQGGPEDMRLGKFATIVRKIFISLSFLLRSLAALPSHSEVCACQRREVEAEHSDALAGLSLSYHLVFLSVLFLASSAQLPVACHGLGFYIRFAPLRKCSLNQKIWQMAACEKKTALQCQI